MTSFYGKSCSGCNTYICFQFHRICFLRFPLYLFCFYFGFFIKSVETISPLASLQAFCVVINITDVTRITEKNTLSVWRSFPSILCLCPTPYGDGKVKTWFVSPFKNFRIRLWFRFFFFCGWQICKCEMRKRTKNERLKCWFSLLFLIFHCVLFAQFGNKNSLFQKLT